MNSTMLKNIDNYKMWVLYHVCMKERGRERERVEKYNSEPCDLVTIDSWCTWRATNGSGAEDT